MKKFINLILFLILVPSLCFSAEICITMPKVSSYPFSERVYHFNKELDISEIYLLQHIDGVDEIFRHHGRYAIELRKGLMFYWSFIDRNIKGLFDTDKIDFCDGFSEGYYIYNRPDAYASWFIED